MTEQNLTGCSHPRLMTSLFIFLACMIVGLPLMAQSFDFKVKDVTVRDAVIQFQKQTGYSMSVDADKLDMNRHVTVTANKQTPEQIIRQIFTGQNISCSVKGKTVTVGAAKKTQKKADKPKTTRMVEGTVSDTALNEPLIGVTIFNRATGKGVSTDLEGHYSIAADPGQTLEASYVGYTPIKVKVGADNTLDINMNEASTSLNELVVVGFGVQKKINLTGAVGTIDKEQINGRPVANAATALQGLDPSMNIGINSGRADAGYTIDIRGAASLNSSSPLILVDGVEMPLSRINPNDIESVSILKDASAAAVYGAKASAGVVLVTTKSGTESKPTVSFNGRIGWASNTTSTDYITCGYDWAKVVDEFYYNYNNQKYLKYNDEDWAELEKRRYDKTENPERPWVVVGDDGNYKYYGNFDWYNYYFRKTRPQQEYNLSLTGGTDRVKYYVSGRYYKADGMMNIHNDPFESYNFRGKINVKLTNWARFSTNFNYFHGRTTWVGFNNIEKTFTSTTYGNTPLFSPLNPDGSIVHLTDCVNQGASVSGDYNLLIHTGNNRNKEEDNDVSLKSNLDIDIVKGLQLHLSHAYRTKSEFEMYRRTNAQYSHSEGKFTDVTTGYFLNQLQQKNSRTYRHIFEGYLDYSLRFSGNHNFKAMVGTQYENYHKRSESSTRDHLMTDDLDDFDLATGETYKITGGKTAYRTLGFFGRINYDYDGKYLLELSGRADGSSRFREGHRWGFFPSGSLGWRVSQENFWEPIESWWNNFKLRASVGSLGNQQVSDFLFFDKITTDNYNSGFTFNGNDLLQYSGESAPVSSALTWEKVTTYDIGIDWGFLNNRLTLTGDYYIRRTTDMMMPGATLPGVYGASAPKETCADMRTNGWELSVRWHDRITLGGRPFSYSINGSIGDYQTVVTRFNNETRLIDGTNYKGQHLGEIWGYVVDGLFQSDEEAAAYQQQVDCSYLMGRIMSKGAPEYKRLVAGDLKYVDLDGSGAIDRGKNTVDNPGDRKVIGNTLPRYSYTFGGDCTWNGIDFSILFQGVGKRDWYPGGGYSNLFWGPYCRPHGTFLSQQLVDQIWSPENPDGYFPFPRGMEAYSGNSNSNFDASNSHYTLTVPNTRYLQNVAYLRLKNITLGYTLPVLKKYVSKIRVYVTAENLAYWSPLKKHCKYIDPEGAVSGISTTTNSGEVYNFSKTFSVGLDVTF